MPIFEYQCRDCTEVYEVLQLSRAAEETPECPECGSKKSEKLVSAFACSGGDAASAAGNCNTSSGFR